MGKKNKGPNLGRALIKDRFGSNKGKKMVADNSMLHTTEVQDGYDWGRLNLQSVTEESSFQEFLSTAELTGAEFQAEKLNIKFVNPLTNVGLLNKDELKKTRALHEQNKQHLTIPRRPPWSADMSRDQLDTNEKEYFLEWRRSLARLQEDEGMLLTPYEKNLEFWRQLWRVVERSDVVVQIVDARNPLLFRCEDLEKYVKEVSPNKQNIILINKADHLTDDQRQAWADYFTSVNVRVIFYSALLAAEPIIEEDDEQAEPPTQASPNQLQHSVDELKHEVEKTALKLDTILNQLHTEEFGGNTNQMLTREQLTQLFREIHIGPKVTPGVTTIGLVGYPNVGKSSTINSLMLSKKVSVSQTPGKTKHFQTLFLDNDILLCDCPGLVTPTFVFTKAEMVVNGVLPIDQMRDHVPPINLITNFVPRHVIEDKYGIMIPLPIEGEDPDRPPTSEELLNAYAYNRGFMTNNGQPDNPRAARYILKDFMNGRLLFCHCPPNVQQVDYHKWPERQKIRTMEGAPPRQIRAVRSSRPTTSDVDSQFFRGDKQGAHVKGKGSLLITNGKPEVVKPWKKHDNRNKKEKLRRVYVHLDQH